MYTEKFRLTKEGEGYRKNGLPEKNLFEILKGAPLSLHEIQKRIKNPGIALQWLKKKKLI